MSDTQQDQERARNQAELIAYLLASEENEQTYRRGYRQGWQMAVERLGDLLFDRHFSPKDAFIRLQRHGVEELTAWSAGDKRLRSEPPICPLAPLGEALVDQRYTDAETWREGEES